LECELYRETVVTSPGPSTKETIAINAFLELVYIHDYEILTCWISDNPRDVLSRLLIHVLVIVFGHVWERGCGCVPKKFEFFFFH
jgi:hypothetical protein